MHLFEIFIVTVALGLMLAVTRFAMLAFMPAHPLSQLMARLDRMFDASR